MKKNLKVAFVGVKRPPSELPDGYLETFVRFHLELPWYYAMYSKCDVSVTLTEPVSLYQNFEHIRGGSIDLIHETELDRCGEYDVVVHWRRWFPEFYRDEAVNVILSQDHSYGEEWKATVRHAYGQGQLDGILVFPTWHRQQIARELVGVVDAEILIDGLTLGVDTTVYKPAIDKDPFHLLWASDPGRGLEELIPVFLELWTKDRRFKLTVTYPDYVKGDSLRRFTQFLNHPAVTHMPGLRNGDDLWNLFNRSGVLPYSSTFMEPSSRCHRQAMAAGSFVLYPPGRGSPSELIEDGMTGVVAPVLMWPEIILDNVRSGRWKELGYNARAYAASEDWLMQATRFFKFFSERVD